MIRLTWNPEDTVIDLFPSHTMGQMWLGPKTMQIRSQSDEQAAKILKCTVDELMEEQERNARLMFEGFIKVSKVEA